MQKWNTGSRCKLTATPEEEQDFWQDIQEDHSSEDPKAHRSVTWLWIMNDRIL
jgi:hypothetical protein